MASPAVPAGLLAALAVLSGCAGPSGVETDAGGPAQSSSGTSTPPGDHDPLQPGPASPLLPGIPVAFAVVSHVAGPIRLAGTLWDPGTAEEALVIVPGSAESSAMYGDLGVPGYAFGPSQAAPHRAVLALDLPGHGASGGQQEPGLPDDHANLVAQVAVALEQGDYEAAGGTPRPFGGVVGLGVSTGGLAVQVAQAQWRPFDALVVASWSHGPFSERARACFREGRCPEDPREWAFHLPNADPRVAGAVTNMSEAPGPLEGQAIAAWSGEYYQESDATLPAPEDASRLVQGPVLLLYGAEDFFYDAAHFAREPDHFPLAAVDLVVLPGTGHAVFHHRGHAEVEAALRAWLDRTGGR